MATISQLVSDVELRLSGGNVSDDFIIDKRQIIFWLDSVRSKLIEDKIIASGSLDLSSYVKMYPCNVIESNLHDCCPVRDGSSSVKLPISILSLKDDLGVYRVETSGGKTISRIRLSEMSRLKKLKFSNIGKSNLTWYRVHTEDGPKLFIQGGSYSFKKNGKVNLYLIPSDTSDLDEGEEYPIESSMIYSLLNGAEEIGRRELSIPEDIENDGEH